MSLNVYLYAFVLSFVWQIRLAYNVSFSNSYPKIAINITITNI
jgi:hypothetical protein